MRRVPTWVLVVAVVVAAAAVAMRQWTAPTVGVPAPATRPEPRGAPAAGPTFVIDAIRDDGSLVRGATVTLSSRWDDSSEGVAHVTDERGRCEFGADEITRLAVKMGVDEIVAPRVRVHLHRLDGVEEVGLADPMIDVRATGGVDAEDRFVHAGVRVRPGVRVGGTVTDEDGRPVPGASCTLAWPVERTTYASDTAVASTIWLRDVRTAADGSFEFPWVPRNRPERGGVVRVQASGFADNPNGTDVSGTGDVALVVRLERRLTLSGRCIDGAGRPVPDVRVVTGTGQTACTEIDGTFAIRAISRSDRRVGFESDFLCPVAMAVPGDGRHDVHLGDVVLPEGVTLRALVVDADGAPVPWSIVDITGAEGPPWSHVDRTDAAGRFDREHMPEGTVRLAVHHPRRCAGALPTVAGVPTGTLDEVRVVLPRLPEFALRFVGADADRPAPHVEAATITVWAAEDTTPKAHYDAFRYDVSGDRLVLLVPKPGAYLAQVDVPGFAPVRVERFEVVDGARADVEVRLREAQK